MALLLSPLRHKAFLEIQQVVMGHSGPMSALEAFNRYYNYCLNEGTNLESRESRDYIYNLALSVPESDVATRETVLNKLLFLYPGDVRVYTRLGLLYKSFDVLKASTWLKIGFQINPCDVDNTTELIQILYDNGLGYTVFALNKDNLFDQFIDNSKFLSVYARCNFQNQRYENGVKYLLKLIEISSRTAAVTASEKYAKWQNYHDLGYVYSALGCVEKSIAFTQKAADLAIKFNLRLADKLLSFSNVLSFNCYGFPDNEALFQTYLKINDYLPDRQLTGGQIVGRNKGSKIRVGYVSSDYAYHPIANFLTPILNNHNLDKFEIMLFGNIDKIADIFLERAGIKGFLIGNLDDRAAATLIRDQGVDILIDLNGHTGKNRLGVFSYNPAPVQVTYLGYPNTTGLKAIKYRLTDRISNPEGSTEKYSEELVRLERGFLLYKPVSHPILGEPPLLGRELARNDGIVVLGALNKENKNSVHVLSLWKRILRECPSTKLLIKLETRDNYAARLIYYMNALDVVAERLIVLNKLSDADYNMVFSKIDILVDTFPYSGTTTTCNALYNSVPVVTLYNPNHHCHCVSASLLENAGLDELVAYTESGYVDIIKKLVSDVNLIKDYKQRVSGKFKASMEPAAFMESYEASLSRLSGGRR